MTSFTPTHPAAHCLPDSILRAVATGRIPEPVLGVYLQHVETCDSCCARIGQAAAGLERATAANDTGVAQSGLDHWLRGLKQEFASSEGDDESLVGSQIGPFRILDVLGTGGSSIAYEAIDEHLGRTVVLKVLRTEPHDAFEQHRLVIAEARALAAVQHDAIMPLLQLLWHDGVPVLVFPRLAGETLADSLTAGSLTARQAVTITRDVARGLAHAHGLGIFHHDVKPSNIWLQRRPDGQVAARIFDFGLSGSPTVVSGTPGYADPETAAGCEPQPRDLFSLGVVLHECLSHAGSADGVCRDLVRRLTAADPAARPRAAEVAAELDRLLRPRTATWRLLAAAAAMLACVAAVWTFTSSRLAPASGGGSPAQVGPLQPEIVIPAAGIPVAISGDGRTRCSIADGSALEIETVSGGTGAVSVPIGFSPDRLAFNEQGTRLAAADAAGNVAIVDIPSASITMTHHFVDGVAWLGWAGWNRDAVVVLSGRVVHAFFKTRRGTPALDALPEWLLDRLRDDVRAIATLPGTEAVLSMDHGGHLTMWSVGRLTEDMPVQLSMIKASQPQKAWIIGWKSPGVCFFSEAKTVVEVAPYHGMATHRIPAPAKAIAWPDETRLVMLTREAGRKPRLLLADRTRADWSREFDLGDATVEEFTLLADRRRIAAITSDGGLLIYRLPERH